MDLSLLLPMAGAAVGTVALYTLIGFVPGTDETSVLLPVTLTLVLAGPPLLSLAEVLDPRRRTTMPRAGRTPVVITTEEPQGAAAAPVAVGPADALVTRRVPHEAVLALFLVFVLLLAYLDAGLVNIFAGLLVGLTCGTLNRLGVSYAGAVPVAARGPVVRRPPDVRSR